MTAATNKAPEAERKPKDKEKKDVPPSKVIVRRLPPTMTEEQFIDQVSPLPEYDYFRYVDADWSLEQDAFCRAYINFNNQQDIFIFQEKFDGYVFVDARGNEFKAIVEFAPNQKICRQKDSKKKDTKMGTLEQDPEYLKFLESLENVPEPVVLTVAQNLEEIEERERQKKAGLVNTTTPLLQFFKENREEKVKKREEQKAFRKKKEEDRKKHRDEERQRRRELKEKEMRDAEKKTREKKNASIEDDIKSRQKERREKREKERREREEKDSKKDDETTEKEVIKDKKEIEREKRLAREEREKERFRKREEEKQRQRERKRELIEKKKEKEKSERDESDKLSEEKKETLSHSEKFKNTFTEVVPEAKEESKTKKYSDKRKEERQRREREREKVKKKDDDVEIIDIKEITANDEHDSIKKEVAEDLKQAAESYESRKKAALLREEEKKARIKKTGRERREEREKRQERLAAEKDQDEDSRRGLKKKPDMQIYRPGMGRFSSKNIRKEEEDETNESRETSPHKKINRKKQNEDTYKYVEDQSSNKETQETGKGKSYRGARMKKKASEETPPPGTATEEGGDGKVAASEEHKNKPVGPPSDKDITPITSTTAVITIDNDL